MPSAKSKKRGATNRTTTRSAIMRSPASSAAADVPSMRDKLGVCQWFHFEDHDTVRRSVRLLRELGVRHLRTGVSWADFLRPGGKQWYDWQMRQLEEFEVLLSVWHTPPSISE